MKFLIVLLAVLKLISGDGGMCESKFCSLNLESAFVDANRTVFYKLTKYFRFPRNVVKIQIVKKEDFLRIDGDHPSLLELVINYCSIKNAQDVSKNWNFGSLQNLDLSKNELENFDPIVISKLRNLRELNLAYNCIQKLKSYHFSRLISLTLNNNKLEDFSVEDAGSETIQWEHLDLSENNLDRFHLKGSFQQNMKIYLNQNQIEDLKIVKELYSTIDVLNVSSNHLEFVKNFALINCKVNFLDLSSNQIAIDKELETVMTKSTDFYEVVNLDLSRNLIVNFEILNKFKFLKNVNFEGNIIRNIDMDDLHQRFPTLISVNLKDNPIQNVFEELHHLQVVSTENYWNQTIGLAFIQHRKSKIIKRNLELSIIDSTDQNFFISFLIANFCVVLVALYLTFLGCRSLRRNAIEESVKFPTEIELEFVDQSEETERG